MIISDFHKIILNYYKAAKNTIGASVHDNGRNTISFNGKNPINIIAKTELTDNVSSKLVGKKRTHCVIVLYL
jgi:hypothetical protein